MSVVLAVKNQFLDRLRDIELKITLTFSHVLAVIQVAAPLSDYHGDSDDEICIAPTKTFPRTTMSRALLNGEHRRIDWNNLVATHKMDDALETHLVFEDKSRFVFGVSCSSFVAVSYVSRSISSCELIASWSFVASHSWLALPFTGQFHVKSAKICRFRSSLIGADDTDTEPMFSKLMNPLAGYVFSAA